MTKAANAFEPITQRRIFVTCPGGVVTGGPELLHQLVTVLVRCGRDARIVYTPVQFRWTTPPEYERYHCPVATSIPDEPDVAVVVPEVSTHLLQPFRRARPVIWWLSVDHYKGGLISIHFAVTLARRLLWGRIAPGTTHLFQCAHARHYVAARLGQGGAMLSDYLADEYLEHVPQKARRDVVAYNPKKGRARTLRLIRALPTIEFLPLEGMTRLQVREALETCKVYIDLGEHPGKDRLPREAAARGAIVIVGKRGAASNDEDVPLPGEYKLDARCTTEEIGNLIKDCFARFESHAARQQSYRGRICAEPAIFKAQIDRVFAAGVHVSGPSF